MVTFIPYYSRFRPFEVCRDEAEYGGKVPQWMIVAFDVDGFGLFTECNAGNVIAVASQGQASGTPRELVRVGSKHVLKLEAR